VIARRLWPGPAVGLLLIAAGACSVPVEPAPGEARQTILGGALEPGSPAVAAIVPVSPLCGDAVEAAPVTCTGTLIAPRVVLTAAHCVENLDAPQVLSAVFAQDVASAIPTDRVRAVEGRLHPSWSAGENDIGVLILAEDAPVAPASLDLSALPSDLVGRSTRLVGFGVDDQGQTGRRRSGTARVAAVDAGTFSIVADPGMSCDGDSGGPSFLDVDGAERLIGVTSFGDPACTTGTNTRVDVHAAFLQTILDDIAKAPPARRPLDPTVDACAALCESHADCPLGMACVPLPGGGKSCAVAGLEAGHFGAICTGSEGDQLCVKAGEATCRLWLPCAAPETDEGGCSIVGASGAGAEGDDGAGVVAALLALVVRRRTRRGPAALARFARGASRTPPSKKKSLSSFPMSRPGARLRPPHESAPDHRARLLEGTIP
jgi:trypsin